MKKGLTELVFVLDRSGSMGGLEEDVIGGFNSVISKHKNDEVIVSTVLFDHETDVVHNRINIKDIRLLTDKEYSVRGSTALLDALGKTIKHISNIHKHTLEEERPENILFFINTDGMENSSHIYTYKKIKTLINSKKEKYNWEFIFMGANIDAFDIAEKIGIKANRAINFIADKVGVKRSYSFMESAINTVCFSCCLDKNKMLDDMCCEENKEFEKRNINR